jgi:hypothetical protein
MSTVFYLYDSKKKSLNNLISEFQIKRWCFREIENYFHTYEWPDVVLSDKDSVFKNPFPGKQNDFVIEMLGCYDPEADQIVLYMPKIKKTAEKYIVDEVNLKITDEPLLLRKNIENLCTLVLLHEFTHWIVAKGVFTLEIKQPYYSSPIHTFLYTEKEHIYFHEAVAQIFTYYFCKKDTDDLLKLFYWLQEKQPEQYHAYKELLNTGSEAEIDQKFIDETIFALMILALSGEDDTRQHFDNLKIILGKIRGHVKDDKFFETINTFDDWDWKKDDFEPFVFTKRGKIDGVKYGI